MSDEKPVVLVVDDEMMNRRLIEAMLTPLGYTVILAQNGLEALDLVTAWNPDVILLDIMMPEMDGFEVARRVKAVETTAIIPIVMVTALYEVEDRVKALEAGADDFLTKPVDKTELRARVKSLVKVKSYHSYLQNYQRQLQEEVERKTSDLQDAMGRLKSASLDTIFRLSRAAVYKDEGTGAHIKRISHYAAVVAEKLGLSGDMVESTLHATPMHDIGKIGIPDRILLKPGKLTPEEWEIMKEHTTIGAKILEGSDVGFLRLAEIIALTHHEKWDGSGYPQGLSGERIPIAGRITAVVDVFDALVSHRPYKMPLSNEDAFQYLRDNRGTHFDPQIVAAFLDSRNRILEIQEQTSDIEGNPLFTL